MSLAKIRPIENLSQVDKIEMNLQEYLRTGNFQPGDSLPKETELAEAMGVSRTAIREALSRFRTLGIIETRKNRGMIISQPDVFNNMERILDTQLLDDETLNEIFEMRLVIEVGLGDVIFLRKHKADFSKLEKIIEKEEKATTQMELVKCDIEFHSMLYNLSGNRTIMRFQKMLLPVFDHVYTKLKENTDAYLKNISDNTKVVTHLDLLNTLKDGDPEQFRSQMRTHLMVYFKQLSTD
ncbi:FadR family transcriptional regulator [Sphingobacterium sp. SGG-5]|uniref:FadR/GntR family transcriptional regulator n=1 Tax=Sphingobacterium sp. SGG-5 TaxID=2710881 RepID=UPI0013ED713A|nr:GntR family transcriptional regulator [Sphingobacterium sp. SGG-5]NGM63352.1 FadR family transcriptional regulator [Sphingobacterium sp. SGG-5]